MLILCSRNPSGPVSSQQMSVKHLQHARPSGRQWACNRNITLFREGVHSQHQVIEAHTLINIKCSYFCQQHEQWGIGRGTISHAGEIRNGFSELTGISAGSLMVKGENKLVNMHDLCNLRQHSQTPNTGLGSNSLRSSLV